MTNRIFPLVALTFTAACGGSAATTTTTTTTTLPSLSVLDTVDSTPAPALPTGCVQGFQTTLFSHMGYDAAFVRRSDAIWHEANFLDYQDAKGTTYRGLRAADSTALTAAQSVAWVEGSAVLGEDPSNTATLFFVSADAQQGRQVLMAREVGGNWQVDPTPVWTGQPTDSVVDLAAGFDHNGFAHVVIQLPSSILLGDNTSGSWSVSDFAAVEPNLQKAPPFFKILDFLVDDDGHVHMTFDYFDGSNVYATDRSGAWVLTGIPVDNVGALTLDASNAAHYFSWVKATSSIHDSHETALGFIDQDLAIPTKLQTVSSARIDASGGVHLLLKGQSFQYITNAGGTVTSLIPPDLSDSNQTVTLEVDAAGQPHFAYSYNPSADHLTTFAMALVDICH